MAARPARHTSIVMPSESASTASAPWMIGLVSPAPQSQIASPMAVSSATAVSAGTSVTRTKRELNSPTISTTTDPPTTAISGESAW